MNWAVFAWGLVLVFVLLGPYIERGADRAHHNGFQVWLPDVWLTESRGQSPRGVEAQEVAEWKLAWLCGLLLALPLLFAPTISYTVHWLVVPVVAAFGQTMARMLTNGFDYVGHGIEIMVAEEEGRAGYREQEIWRMIHHDPARKGMTIEQVDAKLRRWHWLAKLARWIP